MFTLPAPPLVLVLLYFLPMRQAHAEYLTTEKNCGYLANSDLKEHGYGENVFLCWGQAGCMLAPGVLESICE